MLKKNIHYIHPSGESEWLRIGAQLKVKLIAFQSVFKKDIFQWSNWCIRKQLNERAKNLWPAWTCSCLLSGCVPIKGARPEILDFSCIIKIIFPPTSSSQRTKACKYKPETLPLAPMVLHNCLGHSPMKKVIINQSTTVHGEDNNEPEYHSPWRMW